MRGWGCSLSQAYTYLKEHRTILECMPIIIHIYRPGGARLVGRSWTVVVRCKGGSFDYGRLMEVPKVGGADLASFRSSMQKLSTKVKEALGQDFAERRRVDLGRRSLERPISISADEGVMPPFVVASASTAFSAQGLGNIGHSEQQ